MRIARSGYAPTPTAYITWRVPFGLSWRGPDARPAAKGTPVSPSGDLHLWTVPQPVEAPDRAAATAFHIGHADSILVARFTTRSSLQSQQSRADSKNSATVAGTGVEHAHGHIAHVGGAASPCAQRLGARRTGAGRYGRGRQVVHRDPVRSRRHLVVPRAAQQDVGGVNVELEAGMRSDSRPAQVLQIWKVFVMLYCT